MTDLERAYNALSGKVEGYKTLFSYYDGDQPVMYTASRLAEIFRGIDAVFTENWCAVVIDSTKDRINLSEIVVPDANAETWKRLWDGSELKLESDDTHEAVLVTGEAFLIAWPDEENTPQAYYNDPRLCHVFYDPSNPRVKQFAAKWFVDSDETVKLTLYYPDRLEYYRAQKDPSSANAFQPEDEPAANEYGEIPVFHFRLGKRTVKSDLKSVIPIQNGINKLLADMMVAAEFGAFKQRYVISNADTAGKLKNKPGEVWDVPAGDGVGQQTQIGELSSTDLDNYLKSIDNLSVAISSITRTPKYYFFSAGSNLSGEALIAMEAPLNKKAQDRIDRFIPVWRDVARFMLKISGEEVDPSEIHVEFDKPATIQPLTDAQILSAYVGAGVPLLTAVRWTGKDEEELAQLEDDMNAAEAKAQTSLAQGLLEAQRRFNAGAGAQPTGVTGAMPANQNQSTGVNGKVTNV